MSTSATADSAAPQPSPPGDQAKVSIRVAASPELAFEAFTRDINLWWRRGPRFRNVRDARQQGLICMEAGVGGRVFESVGEGPEERVIEIGRIAVWEPPRRLQFSWRASNFAAGEATEVEVLFAAGADGGSTLVTVMHRGWSKLRADHPVRHGLDSAAFIRMHGMWWADLLRSLQLRLEAA